MARMGNVVGMALLPDGAEGDAGGIVLAHDANRKLDEGAAPGVDAPKHAILGHAAIGGTHVHALAGVGKELVVDVLDAGKGRSGAPRFANTLGPHRHRLEYRGTYHLGKLIERRRL